jgi:hypothetical protein
VQLSSTWPQSRLPCAILVWLKAIDGANGNPARIAEGIFRLVAFDWTTGYGLHPARALLLILIIWALLIPIYSWAIWQEPRQLKRPSGIYRTWPKERIELREAKPTLDNPAYIERLRAPGMAVLGWSAYFVRFSNRFP